jgi:hypothetical protein
MVIYLGQSLSLLTGKRSWRKTFATCLLGIVILGLYPMSWRENIPGAILTALVGMIFLFGSGSAIVKFIFPPTGEVAEDFLDDLFAFHQWLKVRANFASFFFNWIERFLNVSWVHAVINWLNPRQHAWRAVILVALGMGSFLLSAEAIAEGAPDHRLFLLVLSVYLCLEGVGVLLGYNLFKDYLGIFRT